MLSWHQVVNGANSLDEIKEELSQGQVAGVYQKSVHLIEGTLLFLVNENQTKFLIVAGDRSVPHGFEGTFSKNGSFTIIQAPLNCVNAQILRNLLPWTAPQAFGSKSISLGLGDRLGLASPGHLQAITGTEVRPVLAQQSKRELVLTGRTYRDVLDAATWAVFQEGYKKGFGADGDHLKRIEDIQEALDLGFSMITLDCSEYIDESIRKLKASQVRQRYQQLSAEVRARLENSYLESHHLLEQTRIEIDEVCYYQMVLTYYRAIEFIALVYNKVISKLERAIDFEISIDEVEIPTTPQDHFFVANELSQRKISVSAIAPRFCGRFEKGIDYVGDRHQFQTEFIIHTEIARHFGYKLSIHSGSDKFAVFPIIGKYSGGAYHLKTAGTNWLEAVRVIASVKPSLYRQMHRVALATLKEAQKYYQVSLNLANIPDIEDFPDQDLPGLLEQNDARQLLHITYGFILQQPELRQPFFTTLKESEDVYADFLRSHLEKHLLALGVTSIPREVFS